jgi:hypothetical protein
MIIDDFHPEFDALRKLADGSEFKDFQSPVDGVFYPGICPIDSLGLGGLLAQAMGRSVSLNHQFMRLSLAGACPPHWAHHDGAMGDYSLMLYLNRPEHCQGGTALLRHLDGEPSPETWAADTNEPSRWKFLSMCDMQPNRAFIFRANLWHAALPMAGFGKDASDGRLVLTVFFS